jgi:outer membrane lipoprotein-sorting protein
MNKKILLRWAGISQILFAQLGLIPAFIAPALAAPTMTGKDVMLQNEERRKVDDIFSTATLTTGGGGTPERVKQFSWWRKLSEDKIHFNTLTRFHLPAEIRGEGILFLERVSGENEVMMYLPNFKKIRRVESQAQSGSFMGSEFSYSDIATAHVDDYKETLLKEELCPGSANAGVQCYVIESLPLTDEIQERTGYARTVTWIRQDNFMGVRGEHFNKDKELIKRMEATEIKVVDAAKNKWMAHKVKIENVKSARYTLLTFSQVKANQGIPDATFTQQNLSRGN